MAAAAGVRHRPHAPALVEGVDRDAGIAQSLQRHDAEQGRLAGAGRAEHQRVTDVADMEIHPEWRGAGRGGIEERRRGLRVERAGILFAARPDARQGQHIGQVGGVDQRPADIRHRVARQGAEPRFHGVHRLDPGCEPLTLDFPDDLPAILD